MVSVRFGRKRPLDILRPTVPKSLFGSLIFNGHRDELRDSAGVNSRIRARNNAELLCNCSLKGYETESSEGDQYLLVYCLMDADYGPRGIQRQLTPAEGPLIAHSVN